MNVVRIEDAPTYRPAGHVDMRCLRLQGHETGPRGSLILNLCHLLPGGSTGLDASPVEKIYVVVEGRVVISNGETEEELGPLDSCRVRAREPRLVENRTNQIATLLLSMPDQESAAPMR
jgi:mannose-6-phosphate isomerase-like protein (cupin superfamily)